MKTGKWARFFRWINAPGLRLLFRAGSAVEIREAVEWERLRNVEK